jgi:hypothetical protein
MLAALPPKQAPWPVAPRPFSEESMGSWLGRLAARYHMEVMQFGHINDLALPTPNPTVGWLLMPPLPEATIDRLAKLGRVSRERIEQMQTPTHWIRARTALPYCSTCLFLNPRDVSATALDTRLARS